MRPQLTGTMYPNDRRGARAGTQAAASGTAATAGRHAAELLGPGGSQGPSSGQAGSVQAHVLHAWSMPASPHLAVEQEGVHMSHFSGSMTVPKGGDCIQQRVAVHALGRVLRPR